ncbi:3-hydroxyacyl-CoA dehydrogenase NAD-binding domain-containing protein [Bordetella genomosp. 13]|uniref:3-hydroxyacyl-CoA dehydrogenase NAD-binding domain-containing protein n=1 Tax=Bordetella genomosp. 13 TaxID=463040 RepID=UPI0011A6359E|nr:3-hydroxyacyl-CoA dehydrogenase NAD-binding domain-containing protein [Bordetella genomosp. 13]
MHTESSKKVAIVSTGVIGANWATLFLARGYDVVATDPSPQAESALHARVAAQWPTMQALGLSPGADPARLRFTASLEDAVADACFVQESAPERIDVKVDLFRRMDAAAPPDTLLASSSSGLSVTAMQQACAHPERVVLGHPFNPPHLIPLVEVCGGEKTAPEAVRRAMDFYAGLGKRPVHVRREISGHIANRLQAALWREAFHLVDQGVASVADIDTVIAHGPGLRWALLGPFLNMHLSGGNGGIDHMLAHLGQPIEDWWNDLGAPAMTDALKGKVVEGVDQAAGNLTPFWLETRRDKALIELLRMKAACNLPPHASPSDPAG